LDPTGEQRPQASDELWPRLRHPASRYHTQIEFPRTGGTVRFKGVEFERKVTTSCLRGRPLNRAKGYAVVWVALTAWVVVFGEMGAARSQPDARSDSAIVVRPLVEKYCLSSHSAKVKKGSLALERFATIDDIRKDL